MHDEKSKRKGRTDPLLSVRKATTLSPASFYSYLRNTLALGHLAETGRREEIRNIHYLRVLLGSILNTIDTGVFDSSNALFQVLRVSGCVDRIRTFLSDIESNAAGDVRRSTTAMMECFGRAAGIDLDGKRIGSDEYPAQARVGDDLVQSDRMNRHLPLVLFIPHLRSPYNLGGLIRTAAAFGLRGVVLGSDVPSLDHPRTVRSAMGAIRLLDIQEGTLDDALGLVPEATGEIGIVALETGGRSMIDVCFPKGGVLIAGHEELGVSAPFLDRASQSGGGIVTIPLSGAKASLNVGVATGIALSWWIAALS